MNDSEKGNDQDDLKSQLDAIPTPKAAGGGASPAPAKKGVTDQLDAIPTPEPGKSSSGASIAKDDLDAIPTPGAGKVGQAPEKEGEVPQWMKNYAAYSSGTSGGPQQSPDSVAYRPASAPAGDPPQANYTIIIVGVVIICLIAFGMMAMHKTEPAQFPSVNSTPAPSTPPPSAPAPTPVTPPVTTPGAPSSMPGVNPPGSMPAPSPTPAGTALPPGNNLSPGADPAQTGNNPIPTGNNPAPAGNNPVPTGNNPVPTGNNP